MACMNVCMYVCLSVTNAIRIFEIKLRVDSPFLTTRYFDLKTTLTYSASTQTMNENVIYLSHYIWKSKQSFFKLYKAKMNMICPIPPI